MFERALVPLHLKERRSRVDAVIELLTRLSIHNVRLLHVAGSSAGARRSAAKLESTAHEVSDSFGERTQLTVSAQTVSGSAVSEIIQTGVAQDANVIGVPWKRKNWVQRSLLGSTSLDLIRLSDIPVLIQKTSPGRTPEATEPLSVLYATDLKQSDDTVFPLIESGAFGAIRLTIITAGERAPDPQAESRRVEAAETALSRLAERVRPEVEQVETVTLTGPSKRVIPRFLRREKFHVAVIGKGAAGAQPILGSTAEEVAYKSPGSVLIVPPTENSEAHRA